MKQESNIKKDKRDRIGLTLWVLYCFFLLLSILIIVRICSIQFGWEPDQDLVKYFQPKRYQQIEKPERGAILDCNGKLLAISTPMYNIHMDCTVRKDEFAAAKTARRRDSLENDWKKKAWLLSRELPEVLAKDGKDADYYYNLIISHRDSDLKGRKNVLITKNIDHLTYLRLKELPLFNEGRFKSGMIKTEIETRQYPYGKLAGRVIGDVRINRENPNESRFLGIEGQYDYILHGREGSQWMKRTDRGNIVDQDSAIVEVVHGQDIRTTLDINIQDIADRALRRHIAQDERIQGGCVVVMDVRTGAVRAMVNLQKNSKEELGENFNMAIGRPGEPGSIFKAVTLATLLEDGLVTLGTTIPTNHGRMDDMPKINDDQYIKDWEKKHNTSRISVLDGFKISSNYVFRRLAIDNYQDDPEGFLSRLYEYNLNDSQEFDLTEKGGTGSRIQDSGNKYYLASAAIGYSIMQTPLNMVTFYNAIANNGKMMKPYLIESFEQNGVTTKEFGPEIVNGSIFSKATADTLTRALKMVTLEGTGTRLKNARCVVAGKTGTARTVLSPGENPSKDPYVSTDGERKYQATFVGFFPADEPKYTAIVVVYTKPTRGSVYGGAIPAMTFREIVDNIWSMDCTWGDDLSSRARVPEMRHTYIGTRKGTSIPVPDVKGMGLKDAIYAIENNGYKCVYDGIGHVVSQSPAAGVTCTKGETIKLVLR